MEIHKKVQIVIANKNEVLLFKTNKKRGSFWQNVTGSVEGEETFLAGAVREVAEETGLSKIEFIELTPEFSFKDRWEKDVLEKTFLGLIKEDHPKIIIDPKEHDEFKWHPIVDIVSQNYFYSSNYATFIAAVEKLKKL